MKIKCVASIFDAYYKVVEIVVGKSRRRKVSNKNKNKYTYHTKNTEIDSSGNPCVIYSVLDFPFLLVFARVFYTSVLSSWL